MEIEGSTMCKDRFAACLPLLNHEAVNHTDAAVRRGNALARRKRFVAIRRASGEPE
jgi:hypothetical protein